MLTDKEIAEIEAMSLKFPLDDEVYKLLATVKEQRELLRKCRARFIHGEDCRFEENDLIKQIEEKVK